MNKQEQSVMDEFVNRYDGVNVFGAANFSINGVQFTAEEFTQRARELGWVNGYKWGVEYPTNGKKPELPDDVAIRRKLGKTREAWNNSIEDRVGNFISWGSVTAFRIVDERYKPMPKSELEMSKECLNDFPFIGCLAEHISWGMPIKIKFLGERLFVAEKTDASIGEDREVCGFVRDLRPIKTKREKFGLALWKTINYNDNMQDDEILRQSRFEDYCKAHDAGFLAPPSPPSDNP